MASTMRIRGTSWNQFRIRPDTVTGPPTVGDHLAGELHMDSDEQLWMCTDDGTPGTWRRLVPEAAENAETENPERDFLGSIMDYVTAGTMSALEIVFIRFHLFAGQTYRGIEWFPTTTGQAGKNLRFGIYQQTEAKDFEFVTSPNAQPTNRLAQTAAFTADSVTAGARNEHLFEGGDWTVPATPGTGYYWGAFWTSGGGGSGVKPLLSAGYFTGWLPVLSNDGHNPVAPYDLPATVAGLLTAGGGLPYFALLKAV